jgi:hypothetical protein
MIKTSQLSSRLSGSFICAVAVCACNFSAWAQTPDYSEGWYQIKRTVNINAVADMDLSSFSAITGITSLLSDVSYLTTSDEFTSTITLPVVNINAGTAVYGARLLDVDGLKDYTADLTSQNGRNANEQEISTYYYITPVEADDDGSWRYTVRSANGHYMGPDGRYYAEPKEVYFNSSIGISLGESMDATLNSLVSRLGVSVGSKQYTISASMLEQIPYIDRIEGYSQLKSLVDKLGDLGVKISENSWAKRTVVNSKSADKDSVTCISSPSVLETLSSIAQDSEQLLKFYNDSDYVSLGKSLMKYVGLDLFKLKKIDLSKVTTSSGLIPTHTSITPYAVNIINFGDNFTVSPTDFRTADALTKLSQKTDQNAMVEYVGLDAQAKSITRFYNGGTLFIKNKGAVSDENETFTLVTDNGTDVVDLSRAQYKVLVDNDSQIVTIILSSPKQGEVMGIPSGRWSDDYKTITLDNNGLATLYSPFELTIPEAEKTILGTIRKNAPKVYVATQLSGTKVICSSVTNRIPANTPVIISGDASQSYNFTVVEADAVSATPIDQNILSGTYLQYVVPQSINAYKLTSDSDSNPVLSQLDGENREIPAWQAYLVTATNDAPDSYSLVFEDNTSSLNNVEAASIDSTTVVYDLNGRQVPSSQLVPGIYIINGLKTLILNR